MEGGGCSDDRLRASRKPSSFRLRSPSLNSVRLRRVFDLFDKNGDELITADEMAKALVLLGLDAHPSESESESALQSIISSYGYGTGRGLTFDEFAGLHKSLDQDYNISSGNCESNDLAEAFKVFDEDGDGYISARELQLVLEKLGLPQGREMESVERMISSVDRNHDGVVDFSEFKFMMRNVVSIQYA